jgi:hypothetical protein
MHRKGTSASPPEEQQGGGGWPPGWLMRIPAFARFYRKYEKQFPLIVFAVGFLWDTLTMTRVDNVVDHVILLTYLAALAVMICYTIRRQSGCARPRWVQRLEPYFLWAMQFAQGGLFSSFVIFYFMSVSWTRTFSFFVILLVLLVGNEFLRHRLENPRLLAVLYSFCLFSFLAFFLPTVLARVDHNVFLLAGALSLLVSSAVFVLGYARRRQWWSKRLVPPLIGILATILSVNILYFADLIPPVPLALKTAAIFHHVVKTPRGYEVAYVKPPFYRFWERSDNPFYFSTGESAYCYTSIFAPSKIHIPVRHVWSFYRPSIGWTVTDRIPFEISGGREGGYRGYTRKRSIGPGRWRVELQTYNDRTLGRIDFTVVPSPNPHPPLEKRVIP